MGHLEATLGTPDFPAQRSCLCVSAEKVPATLAGPMGSPDSASPPSRPRDVLARLRLRPPNAHSLPKNASTTEGGKLLKGRPCPKGQMASPDAPRPPQQSWDQRPGRQCTGVRTAWTPSIRQAPCLAFHTQLISSSHPPCHRDHIPALSREGN